MEQELLISVAVMIAFSILKFVELKFIEEEMVALKYFVRDAIEVGIATILVLFGYSMAAPYVQYFFQDLTDSKVLDYSSPPVFTDDPAF